MTRFKTRGLALARLPGSPAAEWRQSRFLWLRLAANDRRIAAFCAREVESNFCRTAMRGAIERHRMALANARELDAWARPTGHVLP